MAVHDPENPFATPQHERLYVVRCACEGNPDWDVTIPLGEEWARKHLTSSRERNNDPRFRYYLAKIIYEVIE
jgi:hypothetical protein